MHITIAKNCRTEEANWGDGDESEDNSDSNDNSDNSDSNDSNKEDSETNDDSDSKEGSDAPIVNVPIDWRTRGNVNEPEN